MGRRVYKEDVHMTNDIVDEEFFKKSLKFLDDESVNSLSKLQIWINEELIGERKKYLEKWKEKKASEGLAFKALMHAAEYTRGTLRRLLSAHPKLKEVLLKPAYLESLKIADEWISSMLELRKEALGY